MGNSLPEVVGDAQAPFAGRIWVRDFGASVELLYKSAPGPNESERLNAWLTDAGMATIGRIIKPGYSQVVADDLPDDESDGGETDRERAMRRARQAVRWKIKAIQADRMLTLTHRENIIDFEESRRVLAKFLALCRREWSQWKFVGVPEQQERGAWHWHIAVAGWSNVNKLRGFWWKAHGRKVDWSTEGKPVLRDGGDTPGNIDMRAFRKGNVAKRTWQPDRLSGYLAKYLGKGMSEDGDLGLVGRASYTCSRGIEYEVRRFVVRAETFGDVCGVTLNVLSSVGAVVPYVWQAPDRRVLWASALRGAPPE